MRVALIGRAICDAATAGTTANANAIGAPLALLTRCWRVPEFRSRDNAKDVDVLDLLGL